MNDILHRSRNAIAQGALTNSKHPDCYISGLHPSHIKRGNGAKVFDGRGQSYVDFVGGLGAGFFGWNNKYINNAISKSLNDGICHSLPTFYEVEAAEKLKEIFFFVDCFKFLKTGSEACMAAIRIARNHHGVQNGNTHLHEMLERKIFDRISHERQKDELEKKTMQSMHQDVSSLSENQGNQKNSSKEILKDNERDSSGKKALKNKIREEQNQRESESLSSSENSKRYWNNHTKAVSDMWREELRSPSSGLHETSVRDMVVSEASRGNAPKWLILSDGYHGHSDQFISMLSPAGGVPIDYGILPLTGNEDLIELAAAVIIEPVVTDYSAERIEYLKKLRAKCDETGALLIFDEIITGFRFKKHSVASYTNIIPDLIVLGKAMAGGMPLAAVGGKREIMNDQRYFVSSTYAGEVASLAGCIAACDLLLKNPSYNVDSLWTEGQKFINMINNNKYFKLEGYPTRGRFVGDEEKINIFIQETAKCYMIFCRSWFINWNIIDELPTLYPSFSEILSSINDGSSKLEGKPPMSPMASAFRKEKECQKPQKISSVTPLRKPPITSKKSASRPTKPTTNSAKTSNSSRGSNRDNK